MFLADMHLHTNYSDGHLEMKDLVDLMGQSGVGMIAITDHLCEEKTLLGKTANWLNKTLTRKTWDTYIEEIEEQAERAWRLYKMLVLPGVEFTKNSFSHKNSAHIVALDIKDYINPDLPLNQIIDEVHNQGGLAIAAHPVFTERVEHQTLHLWHRREELVKKLDAWEVASGPRLFREVQKSGYRMLANSDLHHPRQLESWKTLFHGEKHVEKLKQDIRKQNIDFHYFKPKLKVNKVELKQGFKSPLVFPAPLIHSS